MSRFGAREVAGAGAVLAIDGAERTRLPFRVQTTPEPPVTEHRTGVYL